MIKKLRALFTKRSQADSLHKNRLRFDNIISDKRFNFLENIYQRLFDNDTSLSDIEIMDAYLKFSDRIQTNSYSAAELEWAIIAIPCHFRPQLTEKLMRRGLLSIVYSLGDNIDQFTVLQFINSRLLDENATPYGGLPPAVGLKETLPKQQDTIRLFLDEVIQENKTANNTL